MTLFEAIKSNPMLVNVPNDTIEAAFITRGYDRTEDFTTANVKEMELVSADLYVVISATPDISEGDLSIKYDAGVLMARASNIYSKWEDAKFEETGFRKIPIKVSRGT